MSSVLEFNIGDNVSVTSGPMQGVYGMIVFFEQQTGQYLIRFGEKQQFYYLVEQMRHWYTDH
jgi:hypothetical protein